MVLRLTRALRTWWRFCSDECAMPQRHRGSTREREREIERDGGWRGGQEVLISLCADNVVVGSDTKPHVSSYDARILLLLLVWCYLQRTTLMFSIV